MGRMWAKMLRAAGQFMEILIPWRSNRVSESNATLVSLSLPNHFPLSFPLSEWSQKRSRSLEYSSALVNNVNSKLPKQFCKINKSEAKETPVKREEKPRGFYS
jgi:hypothetical protein